MLQSISLGLCCLSSLQSGLANPIPEAYTGALHCNLVQIGNSLKLVFWYSIFMLFSKAINSLQYLDAEIDFSMWYSGMHPSLLIKDVSHTQHCFQPLVEEFLRTGAWILTRSAFSFLAVLACCSCVWTSILPLFPGDANPPASRHWGEPPLPQRFLLL